MSTFSRNSLLSILVIAIFAKNAYTADFTVDSWLVGVGVFGDTQATGALAGTPNPFLQSHSRMLGDSTATATYDFSWANEAVFRIEASVAAKFTGGATVRSSASGRIDFTTTNELMLLINGHFDRDLPADQMSVRYNYSILDFDLGQGIGGTSFNHNTINGLGAGTFEINDEQMVLAPGSYRLSYTMWVDAAPNSAGNIGTGDGFIEFRIIPEPASLVMLLLFGVPVICVRRRDRNGVYRNA